MLFRLAVPASNSRSPLFTEQALAAIHAANPGRIPLTLLIGQYDGQVGLFVDMPIELRAVVMHQFAAAYPELRIEPLPHGRQAFQTQGDQRCWRLPLRLTPDLFPIKTYLAFEDRLERVAADPLAALLSAVAVPTTKPLRAWITISVRPALASAIHRALRTVETLALPCLHHHPRLALICAKAARNRSRVIRLAWRCVSLLVRMTSASHSRHTSTLAEAQWHEALERSSDKLHQTLFEGDLSLIVTSPMTHATQARRILRELAGAFGEFSSFPAAMVPDHVRCVRKLPFGKRNGFLLAASELASLWHPPTETVQAPTLATVHFREFPPPVHLPTPRTHPGLSVLGRIVFRGDHRVFGMLPEDRFRHLALLGKTGMGKSTLIQNLILSDIHAGRGVCLIDPHGDLAEAVRQIVPRRRKNDLLWFDAADTVHPMTFNPLSCPDAQQRPLVASGVLSAFKKLYGESWGPRLEYILRNALLAVLEDSQPTLGSVLRLLSDTGYRKLLAGRLTDPVVRAYWQEEFPAMPDRLRAEAISPIQNKLGQFVSHPVLRSILDQPTAKLNVRRAMDEGKILLCNLSKGRIGDDASTMLGSLLITAVQLAAMSRANQPEEERRDFFLFVDEFGSFATDAFAAILSEARKYRLSLTLANQYLAQIDEITLAAVFGNVGSLIVFQIGASDAETLTLQLGSEVNPDDLLQIPKYQAYARVLVDGEPTRAFSMTTLAPRRRAESKDSGIRWNPEFQFTVASA